MVYSVSGRVLHKADSFCVVEVGGVGFKIHANGHTISGLPSVGSDTKLFTFLYVREDQLELYGFSAEPELKLFELLIGVSGVGPKTALGVLQNDTVENVMAAILERRSELLTRVSGIGKKTAERIILELHAKIKLPHAQALTKTMDINFEAEEALVGLGYSRMQVKNVFQSLGTEPKSVEDRLREALRVLGRGK